MDELKNTIEFFSNNSGTISLASLFSAGSVIFGWIKLHAKFIGDPLKKLDSRISGLTHTEAINTTSGENRIREIDQLLELQDKRIGELEKEDKSVIATIQKNKGALEKLKTNFENHQEKFSELSATLKELQNLDTQRQVAIGKVQTLLEVFVGKSK